MSDKQAVTVDDILKATDIVELISEVTPLELRGKNHFGLCPFHHEKTPSFTVNEDKQLYHCFSCKASGNALTFVKETKQLSSSAAIKYLAERANITIEQSAYQSPNQKYYTINQDASAFFKLNLLHTKDGVEALEYLKQRQIDKRVIEVFDLGVALNKKDALYQALKKKDYLDSDLMDLGLIQDDQAIYDLFRNRIMFPLHDHHGNVVGFSGRTFHAETKLAKYMNSPGTVVFEKSKVLYNLHRAKKAIKETKRVVIFEGFMDVIAAYRAGVEESVAVMGTALTKDHINHLKSLTNHVVLCFDGDQAGMDATRKFLTDLEKAQFEVSVAALSAKTDPDDYLNKHGNKAFKKLIDDAVSGKDYLYAFYKQDVDFDKITEIERFKKLIFTMIAPMSNVEKNHYLSQMSQDLNISYDVLIQDFNETKRKHLPAAKRIPTIEITDKFKKAERAFIHYFLKDEYYVRKFRHEFNDFMFSDKHARDIKLAIFEYYTFHKGSCIVPDLFIETLTEQEKAFFNTYIKRSNYPYDEKEYEDFLKVMREHRKRSQIKRLNEKKQHAETLELKIKIQKEIDQLTKEAKHGKRKNSSRTY